MGSSVGGCVGLEGLERWKWAGVVGVLIVWEEGVVNVIMYAWGAHWEVQ